MPTQCEIRFDNEPDRVYYGGQMMSGRVTLTLTKEKTVRGIFIELCGRAYCHWTEGTGNKKETHTGNETYLDQRIYFVGERVGELNIRPGTYQYEFSILLPYGLPTSLEGIHGYIRYAATVTLDRPRWANRTFEEAFTVIKPLNLNYDLRLRQPIVEELTKHFNACCFFFCCSSEPLLIVARTPVSGYTPGQSIRVELELTNNSNENVSTFVLQIVRRVKFQTHEDSFAHKIEMDAIATVSTRPLYGKQNQAYAVDLLVPPTPPTDDTSSAICKVHYFLTIDGSTGCCHMNPYMQIPITIGSYPILDEPPLYGNVAATAITQPPTVPVLPVPSVSHHANVSPLPTSNEPSAPFPENDPPSYEQAVCTKPNNDEKKFAPNYPVYRRATSYSSNTSAVNE